MLSFSATVVGLSAPAVFISPAASTAAGDDGFGGFVGTQPPLPTPLVKAGGKKDPQLAIGLVLPLIAYKASAIVNGNTLRWQLDAAIALSLAALVVYLM